MYNLEDNIVSLICYGNEIKSILAVLHSAIQNEYIKVTPSQIDDHIEIIDSKIDEILLIAQTINEMAI